MIYCPKLPPHSLARTFITSFIVKHSCSISRHYRRSMDLSRTIVLFDVDGTLTKPRLSITPDLEQLLNELQRKVKIGLVGGSDLRKIAEQMDTTVGADSEQQIARVVAKYEYVFAENGLIAYGQGKLIGKKSIVDQLGERNLQRFINFCLGYLSKLELPCKRGNFIEFRTGMINVCPVGRSCTQEERLAFAAYDKIHRIREQMVEALKTEFGPDFDMEFVIGGEISIDCFPRGWDKTFCLRYIEDKFDQIHFVGDKTEPGGNDYAIFADRRTIGHSVQGHEHTKQLLTELFFK